MLSRRGFVSAMLCLAEAATASAASAGEAEPANLGIYCEPTLLPAFAALGKGFKREQGTSVAVLTAPATLILAQLKQNSGEDLLVLPRDAMDRAAQAGFIAQETRRDLLRVPIVFACRADDAPKGSNALDLSSLLGSGSLAAPDPTPASSFDGTGLLDRLGMKQAGHGRVIGVANTGDAAFLVKSAAARYGLVFMPDVVADPSLAVALRPDPALIPPMIFAAALNAHRRAAKAQALLDFLQTGRSKNRFAAAGIEVLS